MNRDLHPTAGIGLRRTAEKGRVVIALRAFAKGEIVEVSPVIPFPADQSPAFESSVLEPLPYRWTRDEPELGGEPPANHWSLRGREPGALLLGYGSLINHSYRPSCNYRRRFDDAVMEFFALRAIEPGEEVTVNYNGDPASSDDMWFPVCEDAPGTRGSDSVLGAVCARHDSARVGPSPGRGRGVFALRDIRVGDVIERAPVIVLPPSDYALLDERTVLADYHFPWDRALGSGALVLGLGSLYNHSFAPNADYARDHAAEELIFFATREIEAGEEIRWNYRNRSSTEVPLWFPVIDGD